MYVTTDQELVTFLNRFAFWYDDPFFNKILISDRALRLDKMLPCDMILLLLTI